MRGEIKTSQITKEQAIQHGLTNGEGHLSSFIDLGSVDCEQAVKEHRRKDQQALKGCDA